MKATIAEIQARFDRDVERFSNLETGQSSTVDAPLVMELVAKGVRTVTPDAVRMLDLGCGAGNFSVRIRQDFPDLEVTLVDLSRPMLERAVERLGCKCRAIQGDIRELSFGGDYQVVVATAVLHHMRTDEEWRFVFKKIYECLTPGGSLWVADLVAHEIEGVHQVMWSRYGEYLEALKGSAYRDDVFRYIDYEDTPKPVTYQMELARASGFQAVDLLHKNSCFAAWCAVK